MTMPGSFHCQACGTENEDGWRYCARCGRPLSDGRTGVRRIPGIAFLLNETATPRMRDLIGAEHAEALAASYSAELASLNPAPRRAAAPATIAREAAAAAPVRTPPPPRAPRQPYDWSWLAEQQANIFLFAGAFLVVVAALIYVAYSGQAIDGSLKMSLLVAYTVAFFAAGVACLRIPRVRMAGQVFFGISALLVPLNFVAAYNVFSGQHLSPTAMWLAGSLTTALFYSLVASTGLGKHYAYSAGAAVLSATAAATAAAGVPLPWVPVPFLAVALALSLAGLVARERVRERLTSAWLLEARVLVPIATVFTLGTALSAPLFDGTRHAFSHWFLLPCAALTLAFYAVEAILHRQRYALFAAAGALAALTCSVVFGAKLAPEHYALALIAAGAAGYLAARWALRLLPASFGYEGLRADAIVFAQVTVAAGTAVAILSVASASDPESTYAQQTSWSLLLGFASAAIFFAVNMLASDDATNDLAASAGFALTLTGAATAVVYGADWRTEYYAFAFAAAALALLAASLPEARARLPLAAGHDARQTFVAGAHAAAVAAAAVMFGAAYADANAAGFTMQTRWTALALAAMLAAFYALAALRQPSDAEPEREVSFGAALASLYAVALAAVFALGVSAEYYAFAFIVPAIGLAVAERARFAAIDGALPAGYREQLIVGGRIATVAGIAVALLAVAAGASSDLAYRPQSGVFLPVGLLFAAVFFALDAARKPQYAISAALLACLAGAGLGVTYAAGAGPHWYGVTLAATGVVLALARPLAPRWLDRDAIAHTAAITVTASWLAFEPAYVDYPRVAAGVHLAAALFYAIVALGESRVVDLGGRRESGAEPATVPLSVAWLYASGLTLALGYVYALRGLAATAQESGAPGSPLPILGLAAAMLVAGIAVRRWRPAFTPHLYVMALLTDIAAIAIAATARDLALVLTLSAAASLLIAVYEREPLFAVPAAIFGFGAVAGWQRYEAWPEYVIPAAYSAIGLAAYALGFAIRTRARRWSDALRAAGGLYAMLAPAVGFIVLSNGTHQSVYAGDAFESSALYQWSTLGIALVGLLALVESSFARRGWVVVAGSGVLVVSLMLELGHFSVRDVGVYTAVAGVYLLLLGTLGLWRFRLVPEAAGLAPYVEVLGAAVILLPSAAHALQGGWGYLAVLLAESTAFLLLGVVLRRRGLVAAALTTYVLVAARVLFDAAQALPNWIIVLIAGMALLGVGMAILLGRERWNRIEEALLGWWDAMNAPEHHNRQAPNR